MRYKRLILLYVIITIILCGCDIDRGRVSSSEEKISSKIDKAKQQDNDNTESDNNLNNSKSFDKNISVDLNKFDIASDEDKHSGLMFKPTNIGSTSELSFEKFSGVYTMGMLKLTENQSISMQYSSKVKSGKFNLFILDENHNIIQCKDANAEDTSTFKVSKTGKYFIKVVGDEACGGKIVVKCNK